MGDVNTRVGVVVSVADHGMSKTLVVRRDDGGRVYVHFDAMAFRAMMRAEHGRLKGRRVELCMELGAPRMRFLDGDDGLHGRAS
jgi:hypothetical protein